MKIGDIVRVNNFINGTLFYPEGFCEITGILRLTNGTVFRVKELDGYKRSGYVAESRLIFSRTAIKINLQEFL